MLTPHTAYGIKKENMLIFFSDNFKSACPIAKMFLLESY